MMPRPQQQETKPREQFVTYLLPPFTQRLKHVVEEARAQGKRITLSSLAEELMYESIDVVEKRYLKPTHGPRKGN